MLMRLIYLISLYLVLTVTKILNKDDEDELTTFMVANERGLSPLCKQNPQMADLRFSIIILFRLFCILFCILFTAR